MQTRYFLRILIVLGIVATSIASLLIADERLSYAQSDVVSVPNPARWRVVELDQPEWQQNLPLSTMVSQSRLVIVGVALRNVCRKLPDGAVVTEYRVRTVESMKGNVPANGIITVNMPGGRITEPDGTILEARTRKVRKMQNGKRYVLFLRRSPGSEEPYVTLHGSQGLFELPENGMHVIHMGRSFLLPPADDGEEIGLFLQRLRALVSN